MRAGVPKGGRRVALCDVIVRPSVQFVTTLAWISYFVTFLFFVGVFYGISSMPTHDKGRQGFGSFRRVHATKKRYNNKPVVNSSLGFGRKNTRVR